MIPRRLPLHDQWFHAVVVVPRCLVVAVVSVGYNLRGVAWSFITVILSGSHKVWSRRSTNKPEPGLKRMSYGVRSSPSFDKQMNGRNKLFHHECVGIICIFLMKNPVVWFMHPSCSFNSSMEADGTWRKRRPQRPGEGSSVGTRQHCDTVLNTAEMITDQSLGDTGTMA